MNVTVNYREPNSTVEKQFIENVAKFHARLIKESVNMLNIDNQSKKKILEQILQKYKSD